MHLISTSHFDSDRRIGSGGLLSIKNVSLINDVHTCLVIKWKFKRTMSDKESTIQGGFPLIAEITRHTFTKEINLAIA